MATGVVAEELALNLEEAADVARRFDTKSFGFFFTGLGAGVAIGFFFGYRYNREKIKAEAFKQSEAELAELRETYQRRMTANQPKPSAEEVVEERGYSATEVTNEQERLLRPPGPTAPAQRIFHIEEKTEKDIGWDWEIEMAQRSRNVPHVLHQDEYVKNELDYTQTTYTYYAGDDVLTDEDDTVLNNRENLIGDTLMKFGHGADDADVLFVRNMELELEVEICRSPKRYDEEVMGLEHSDEGFQRMRRHNSRFADDESD